MAYALQSMLKIRVMREDRASAALAAARHALAEAERRKEEREADLAKYEETKEERRDAIFDTVIGKVVSRDGLDRTLAGVAAIDREGTLLKNNVSEAESVVKEKADLETAAHGAYYAALKNRMKIVEHRKAWEEEERREAEYRAEAELEDFVGVKGLKG